MARVQQVQASLEGRARTLASAADSLEGLDGQGVAASAASAAVAPERSQAVADLRAMREGANNAIGMLAKEKKDLF